MEIVQIIFAFLFLVVGLLGSVVPALPGPPLSYIGLLLLQWSGRGGFSVPFLIVWAVITVVVTIMDNVLPAVMTKKFGGSKMSVIGSVIGLIIGMIFFAPIGLILGPFLGAFAGELINNRIQLRREKEISAESETSSADAANESVTVKNNGNVTALKAAFGAFLAFILGTGAKLIIGALMIYYAVKAMFS